MGPSLVFSDSRIGEVLSFPPSPSLIPLPIPIPIPIPLPYLHLRAWAYRLSDRFPYMRFTLPTAPDAPVTLNGGMSMPSWYDIVGFADRDEEKCNGLEKSRDTLIELIENEVSQGIPYHRIVVAGFSQGMPIPIPIPISISISIPTPPQVPHCRVSPLYSCGTNLQEFS